MNRTLDPRADEVPGRSRAWIGWSVVVLAGAFIGGSFLLDSGSDTTAQAQRGGKTRATPVSAAEVVRGPITQRGRYPGELDADATDVAAFYAGRLVSVKVRVGDRVTAGQVVAELDPVDVREQIAQARAQAKAAAADRQRAKVEHAQAVAEVARLEPLARDQLISALEIDRQRAKASSLEATVEAAAASQAEAEARVKLLERRIVESAVRAPFAGRVAARYVDPGAVVSAGARLVRIVATSPLRVRFEVPEQDVPRLANGTSLRVETRATPRGEGVLATVTGIASEISRTRRVAVVEALVEAPPEGWLPGMYAEALVDLRTIEDATLVPSNAVLSRLQPDGTVATGVLVAREGVARWVPVREVARDVDVVAVEGALPAGDRVLVAGHVDLSDGNPILLREEAPTETRAEPR